MHANRVSWFFIFLFSSQFVFYNHWITCLYYLFLIFKLHLSIFKLSFLFRYVAFIPNYSFGVNILLHDFRMLTNWNYITEELIVVQHTFLSFQITPKWSYLCNIKLQWTRTNILISSKAFRSMIKLLLDLLLQLFIFFLWNERKFFVD